ncbi:hypothetical protein [Streptomyces sp. BP-8]|uniref:Uncharacterized protein n=1 Tax=Streptomyces sirii TaxID=3127701 RepID=A0ABZ2QDY3_9ACTN
MSGQTHTLTTVVMVERPDLEVGHLGIAGRTTFRGGPLEGLVQDKVLLQALTPQSGESGAIFRTQGPGIVLVRLVMESIPAGREAMAAVFNRDEAAATVHLSVPGSGSAVEPIQAGESIELLSVWPSSGGSGEARWIWYPLGPQEPPVRV